MLVPVWWFDPGKRGDGYMQGRLQVRDTLGGVRDPRGCWLGCKRAHHLRQKKLFGGPRWSRRTSRQALGGSESRAGGGPTSHRRAGLRTAMDWDCEGIQMRGKSRKDITTWTLAPEKWSFIQNGSIYTTL